MSSTPFSHSFPALATAGVLLGLMACGGGSGASGVPNAPPGPSEPVTVTVNRTPTGLTLDSTFAGFSYEKDKLSAAFFDAANTGLVALFRRLGPGILRVGGNSVDKTTWSATGSGLTAGIMAPPDVDRLAGFLKACGWKVLYGINFATNSTAGMASEASYAYSSLGSQLYGFELGNECDLYASNGLRPTTYTYAQFLAEWQAYQAAILAQVPSAVFTGPASAYNTSGYTKPFAQAEAKSIQLLTQHYYRANGQNASSTLALLLTPDASLPATLQALSAAASANQIPGGARMAEANSFYNGGAPNVSDAYGTSLWAVDFLFTVALNGCTGVNFHGGGDSTGYTPIADSGNAVVDVRPEYYGISLFTLAAQGSLLTTTVAAPDIACSAYAVAVADGSTNLVFVNKDADHYAEVTVTFGKPCTQATLTTLTGTSLSASSGQLLNGAAIGVDGSWSPGPATPQPVASGTFTLYVPPSSAVLAQVR